MEGHFLGDIVVRLPGYFVVCLIWGPKEADKAGAKFVLTGLGCWAALGAMLLLALRFG
ncbi:MAG TPA: hypothetical protein VM452_09020 [Caulifigura sp.]|jgi:hypothetical protein|nr:hypothetical protein [Caulifigura sp.]